MEPNRARHRYRSSAQIDDSARLFALVNLAMGDAVITAWDTKLHFVFWRPLTAIQEGDNDGNPGAVGDPDWQPLINNPNYPDYTSGANNVTGAATRSLALFFGSDQMTFTLHTTNTTAQVQTRTYDRLVLYVFAAQLLNLYALSLYCGNQDWSYTGTSARF